MDKINLNNLRIGFIAIVIAIVMSHSIFSQGVFLKDDGTPYEWLNGSWENPYSNDEIVVTANRDDAWHWDPMVPWLIWDMSWNTWEEYDEVADEWVDVSDQGGSITINAGTQSQYISTDQIPMTGTVAGGQSSLLVWSVEKVSQYPTPTPNLSDYEGTSVTMTFGSTNAPNGRSYALSYKVTASIGSNSTTTYFTQDEISRVRQEYVDMNRQRYSGDPTPTVPPYNDFIPHSSQYYYPGEFVTSSNNISNNKGVMHIKSTADAIASQVNSELGYIPWLTSGYRRPTLQGSTIPNSLHQFGYALDFTPNTQTPTYVQLLDLELAIQGYLGMSDYDTFIHNNDHVHVEKQNISQGGDPNTKPVVVDR